MNLRANLHARQAAAKKRKQRRLGLAGALTALLALSAGAHVKRGVNARAATAKQNKFTATLTPQSMGLRNLPGGKALNMYGKLLTMNFTPVSPNGHSFYYVNGKQVPSILKGPNNRKYIQRNGSVYKLKKVDYQPWTYTTNGKVNF